MSRSTRTVGLLALAVAGVLAAGCGETVIDDVKTEGALKENFESALAKNVSTVDCPSGVEVEPRATFECEVTLSGGEVEMATLRITNEDADVEVVDVADASKPSDADK